MANLVELYDLVIQAQALNGVPLSHGHVYVYALGRTKLMDTWSDIDGESLNPNPVILDNAGQAHIYVSDDFDYTLVFTDEFDNEIFSVDKYLLSKGEHSHADVAVAPSEHIGVSSYHVGEVTVYVPYLTGEVGKVYEGIDPIVVNNDVNRISANHIPLGVQDPLYFVEDSETACIIGCSAQTEIPSALSSKWDNAADTVIANSAQWAEGTEYEAGSYVDIDGHTISVTGLQPEGDYAYNSALSSKLDVTALPQDLVHSGDLTAYQPVGDYLSATDSANFYPIDNPSGFITGVDLTDYATTAQLDEKLDKTDSGNFYPMEGNPSGFLTAHQSLQGYATEQWVEGKGYITGVDIPESSTWNATTNTVSSNSAQWGASNPQIPVTGINGIKISESGDKVVFEVSADYALADDLTGKQDSLTFGYKDTAISSIDNSALYDNSAHARITTLAGRISDLSSNKLDTTAFSDVSGDFYTTANESGFVTTTDLQNVSGEITALIPTALTGDYVEKSAINTITGDNGEYIWTAITGIDNVWISASEAGYATRALTAATADWANHALVAEVAEDWKGASGKLDNSASANFYTTANESGYLTAVPAGTMNESAFGYDANDKISGYNGSAFAGGSDVPEGVMVESGLEYNAVNEISGYNGSAIAQYGAEKQWLVHDDTLVHASNSAQYALGCNISALQRLMGIDETLLWSGSPSTFTTAFTASEPISNFDRIRVSQMIYTDNEYIQENHEYESDAALLTNEINVGFTYIIDNGWKCWGAEKYHITNGTNFTIHRAGRNFIGPNTTAGAGYNDNSDSQNGWIYKVVGIGRKS